MKPLSKKDLELVEAVKAYAKEFKPKHWRGEHISSVYAAVRTEDGSVFVGPNIYQPYSAPSSICAEYSAIALAYAAGHKKIVTTVTFKYRSPKNKEFFTPCGNCREFLSMFGNPWIIVPKGRGLRKAKLSEMLPMSTQC